VTHPFEEYLRKAGLLEIATRKPVNDHGYGISDIGCNGADKRAYAMAALKYECDNVATAAKGTRNDTLNTAAFKLASLIDAGQLQRTEVEQALTNAAGIASINGDHPMTDHEIRTTIESGFDGSKAKVGARQIPDLDPDITEVKAETINGHTPEPETQPAGEQKASTFGTHPPIDAGNFLFDHEDTTTALWGDGDDILWAEGEALMIAGGMGLGKTTLAGQIVRAQLGLSTEVLGLPVHEIDGPILYLAMDRPRQIRRSMLRQFEPTERDAITGRLLIRTGPPIADIAAYPSLLAGMAAEAGASVVYVDSLKDAAIGLSDDKVGAAYNRARQQVLADGVQICELHHNRKAGAGMTATGSVSEVYGSTWLTSGAGSVITLTGEPGDPIIEFRHVKQPLNEVGPWRILNDPDAGRMSIDHKIDLLSLTATAGADGLSAHTAAAAIFEKEKPTKAEVEKARYRLEKLARQGLLVRVDGFKGGANGGTPSVWFLPE
jgi:replicative DNA helicase